MKRALLAALLIIITIFAGGCWDQKEINDLTHVVGLAFDQTENSAGQPEVKFTLQIANPAMLAGGQTSAAGGGSSGTGGPKYFWTTSETGSTVRAALMKLTSRNPRRLFFGHVRVYVLGEKAARSSAAPFMDRLVRSHETRENTFILVTKGEAAKVLEQETPVFRTSALSLNETFTLQNGTQAIMAVTAADFLYRLNSGVTCPVAPVVEVAPQSSLTTMEQKPDTNKNTLSVSGLGIFNIEGKLQDFFDERETLALMTVLNRLKSREITVPFPIEGIDEPVSLGVFKSNSKIKVNIDEDGMPSFLIDVHTACDVWEQFGEHVGMSDVEFVNTLATNVSSKVIDEIETAVYKAQRLNCDVFGFGEEIRRQNHHAWHGQNIKEQWADLFPEVTVFVQCETTIRHRGLTVEAPGSRHEEATE